MSWSRVSKVDEMVKIGDQVKVKVLKIDRIARKLTLGLKQLTPSPWEAAVREIPPRHDGQGKGHRRSWTSARSSSSSRASRA